MLDQDQNTLTILCLFLSWIMGWFLIPSGIYLWRTGKSVAVSPKSRYRVKGSRGYYLPKQYEEFAVRVEEGPKVRRSGIKRLISGIILLLLFSLLLVRYWLMTPDQAARPFLILALVGLLPLLWYFGTSGERKEE